jgi:hypothetical protein
MIVDVDVDASDLHVDHDYTSARVCASAMAVKNLRLAELDES